MTEDQFLDSLFARMPPPRHDVVIPPGDDCAAIRADAVWLRLLATDQLVGDRHYCMHGHPTTPPELAGRKLLARNLSDIAAMGGVPEYCLVSATLPPTTEPGWLQRFFDGILALAGQYGVDMIGGDLAAAPNDAVASLTIVGRVEACHACRRSGAQPGDLLFATGTFGDAVASGHHLTFEPRCAQGRWLAREGRAKAMIDVSDGLLLDAWRMCRASQVGLRLDPRQILKRNAQSALNDALTTGEDYELLVAIAPDTADSLNRNWPFPNVPLRRIGDFHAGPVPEVVDMDGKSLLHGMQAGYDHLQTS